MWERQPSGKVPEQRNPANYQFTRLAFDFCSQSFKISNFLILVPGDGPHFTDARRVPTHKGVVEDCERLVCQKVKNITRLKTDFGYPCPLTLTLTWTANTEGRTSARRIPTTRHSFYAAGPKVLIVDSNSRVFVPSVSGLRRDS